MQGRSLRKVCIELAGQLSGFGNSKGDNGLPQALTIIQEGDKRATSGLQKSAWESPQAFHAFALYRDQPTGEHSLEPVCEDLAAQATRRGNPSEPNALPQVFTIIVAGSDQAPIRLQKQAWGVGKGWCRTKALVQRVAAWDAAVDAHVQKRRLSDIAKMRKRQAQEERLAARTLTVPIMRL
jgi:hypothetical protein